MKIVKNDLYDYTNRYIYQYEKGFKFSLDSILLAEFVQIKSKDKILVDLCTGNGSIPLIISKKYNIDIIGVEIQKNICDLANMSIKENKLEEKIKILNINLKDTLSYIKENTVDVITCNPPYFRVSSDDLLNDIESVKLSRHEIKMNLEDVFKVSKKMLVDKGILYLVHRASRLDEIVILANKYNVGVKEITFIMTKKDNIYTVLVKCVKNAKLDVKISLKNIEKLKTYQNMFGKD